MNGNPKRYDYIDAAKAVAIISVVAGHVLMWDLYSDYSLSVSQLMRIVYSYHNYLFMFLSGIVSVTAIKRSQVLSDIYKRFRSLIVPALAIAIPFSVLVGADITLFFIDVNKWGYWYLFVLFGLYFVCYPFAVLPARYMKWVCVFFVPVWIFIYRHTYLIPQDINNTYEIERIVQYFPYFFVGNIVKRYELHNILFSLPSLIICVAITIFQNYIYDLLGHYLIEYIITLGEVIGIVTLCKLWGTIPNWLLFIGRSTLYIYLFHYIAIEFMKIPAAHNWFAENGNMGIDILAVIGPTIIAILFSLAVKTIIEKSPFLMKWVFYKRHT